MNGKTSKEGIKAGAIGHLVLSQLAGIEGGKIFSGINKTSI